MSLQKKKKRTGAPSLACESYIQQGGGEVFEKLASPQRAAKIDEKLARTEAISTRSNATARVSDAVALNASRVSKKRTVCGQRQRP